jgi:hypothetical protein
LLINLFSLFFFSSLAREAIRQLLDDNQIAPNNGEYHSRMCNFVKTANFVAPVAEKKEEKKGGKK